MFLIYINNLPLATNLLTFMFADNTSASKAHNNLNDLFQMLIQNSENLQLVSNAIECWQTL